jgi:hypothetical protein
MEEIEACCKEEIDIKTDLEFSSYLAEKDKKQDTR